MTQDKILAYIDNRIKFLEDDTLTSMRESMANQCVINELIKVRAIVTFKEPDKTDDDYLLDVDFENVTKEE
jgi:hypothetical protein